MTAEDSEMETTEHTLYQARKEGQQIIIAGPFDDDLHQQIKQLGGQWDGKKAGNRRVWMVPGDKARGVTQVLRLFEREHGERVRAQMVQEQARREARKQALRDAPKIEAGQYGPVAVTTRGSAYELVFDYDKALVERIRSLQGRRFDKERKVWIVDAASAAPLKAILESLGDAQERPASAESADAGASAPQDNASTQKPPATREETPAVHERFLFPVGDFEPELHTPMRLGKHAVVFESRGKPFRIDETVLAAQGPHLIGQVGAQGRYSYYRPATATEKAALMEREANARRWRESQHAARQVLKKAEVAIRANGVKPDSPAQPEGKVFHDTFRPDGTGSRFVIGKDWIWFVLNHGALWSDLTLNNVPTGGGGAMGWRVPYENGLAEQIRHPAVQNRETEEGS